MGQIPHRVRRGILLLSTLSLVACAKHTPYQTPVFSFLSGYSTARDGTPVLVANDAWWQRLNDPTLNALIDTALTGNLDIAGAQARIDEARALAGTVSGPFTATSDIRRQVQNGTDIARSDIGVADVEFSWIFDLFGARAAALRAAQGRVDLAEAEAAAARLAVIASMSSAYLELRLNERVLELRQSELSSRRRTLGLTRELADAEAVTRLEITRAQARVAELEADMPELEAAVRTSRNQIAVLAGTTPGTLQVSLDHKHIPVPRLDPEVGIPADLLRNRPDIQVAERSYYIAVAEIDQAEAARYPQLSLGGAISLSLIGQGAGAATGLFGPELVLPSLPTGAAAANAEARRAAARQALTAWQSAVLDAILEVENALLTYDAATSSAHAASRARRLYREAQSLTREVFGAGEATLTDLTAADEALARSQISEAQIAYQRALAFVELNTQIGAGHGVGAAPPAAITLAEATPED